MHKIGVINYGRRNALSGNRKHQGLLLTISFKSLLHRWRSKTRHQLHLVSLLNSSSLERLQWAEDWYPHRCKTKISSLCRLSSRRTLAHLLKVDRVQTSSLRPIKIFSTSLLVDLTQSQHHNSSSKTASTRSSLILDHLRIFQQGLLRTLKAHSKWFHKNNQSYSKRPLFSATKKSSLLKTISSQCSQS